MEILLKTKNIKVKRDYFESFELDKFKKGIYILKIESNYYSTFKKNIGINYFSNLKLYLQHEQ